jgi:hypothetical protein
MRYLTRRTLFAALFSMALARICPAFRASAVPAESVSSLQSVDEATLQDTDEYAVLNALLAQTISGPDHKAFVIKEHTAIGGPAGDLHAYAFLSEGAYSDFHTKNEKSYILDAKRTGIPAWTLLSKEAEDKLFPFANITSITAETEKQIEDSWKQFYRTYPGAHGILTFSRVGFNSDKSQAVVYMKYDGNVMSHYGAYFLLVRKGGLWEFQTKKTIWISRLNLDGFATFANS